MKKLLLILLLLSGKHAFCQAIITINVGTKPSASVAKNSDPQAENEIVFKGSLNGASVILSNPNPGKNLLPFNFVFGRNGVALGSSGKTFVFDASGTVQGYPPSPKMSLTFPVTVTILDGSNKKILNVVLQNPGGSPVVDTSSTKSIPQTTQNLGLTKISYYDALLLANYHSLHRQQFSNILGFYASEPSADTAKLLKDYQNNVFLIGFITKAIRDTTWEWNSSQLHAVENDLTASTAASGLGGLNVTNFADGLAKFLVKRFKEELTIAFFNKLNAAIDKHPEINALFPATRNVLNTIGTNIYQYSAYLNTLRTAFIKDLTNLYTDFKKFEQLPAYTAYFGSHPEIYTVISNALYFIDQYAAGVHAGDVLAQYDTSNLKFKDTLLSHNLRSAVATIQMLSGSLRSLSPSHYWVPADSIRTFLGNTDSAYIYLGLISQLHGSIRFYKDSSSSLRLDALMATAYNQRDSIAKYVQFAETLGDQAEEISEDIATIAKEQKADIDYDDYYKLYSSSLDMLQDAFSFVDLPYLKIDPAEKASFKLQSGRWIFLARTSGELYVDIRTKNYSSGVLNLVSILDTVLIDYTGAGKSEIRNDILQFGTFAAAIAAAQNSDQVEQAIEAVALPAGSYEVKRSSLRNLSLNAYLGFFGGYEQIQGLDNSKLQLNSYGLTAPVGVAGSWGNTFLWFKGATGWSTSLFLSLIDIGAITAFRFNDTVTAKVPTIQLKDIFSPGLFLALGIPKTPFSLNLGVQMGPNLRSVNVTSAGNTNPYNDYSNKPYVRFSVSFCVDIPLLNLATVSN